MFQPQQSAFGEDAYPEIADKAAAYAFFLVKNHAFLDANKRTAAAAMDIFLEVNGYELAADDGEIEATLVAVAADEIGQANFFAWVNRCVRRGVTGVPPDTSGGQGPP